MPESINSESSHQNGLLNIDDQDNFRFIIDNIPQQLWTATADGKLNFVNQQVLMYFGKTFQEVIGLGWQQFVHPDDLPFCIQVWQQSLKQNSPYQIQFRLMDSNNVYKWHLGRATPYIKNGKVIRWVGTNTNIDDQKKIEESKDDFLSITSHELRTPLTSAKAYLQLALRQTEKENKIFPLLTKGLLQVDRLQSLINNLLDISKINAGKLNYEIAFFNFEELLKDTIESVQQIAPKHKIIISETASVNIKGDRLRLEQVLNNLFSNAIKYSPAADSIIIKSVVQQENLIVSVQDFGIGIESSNLSQLFNRYYRTDNIAMHYEGLGLGLYISAEIIKRHNGSFWIESQPGEGSTFYFLLPLNGKQELKEIATDHLSFYKVNHIEIHFDKTNNWLEANWLGYQNFESVKAGCMVMLDLLKKNNCSKVLNDNTYVLGNWSEASDWGAEFWFLAMQKAGLQHFAWIYSPSTFSRMAAHKSVDVMLGTITAQFFTDKVTAIEWLKQA